MSEYFSNPALILALVPLLVLAALLINYPRTRRWTQKARSHGAVTCRTCGHVGALQVRTLSATSFSSSNLRMVCAKCNSKDWYVPEADED